MALSKFVKFLDKLMTRLSPWYIKHEKLLALIVSSIGRCFGYSYNYRDFFETIAAVSGYRYTLYTSPNCLIGSYRKQSTVWSFTIPVACMWA